MEVKVESLPASLFYISTFSPHVQSSYCCWLNCSVIYCVLSLYFSTLNINISLLQHFISNSCENAASYIFNFSGRHIPHTQEFWWHVSLFQGSSGLEDWVAPGARQSFPLDPSSAGGHRCRNPRSVWATFCVLVSPLTHSCVTHTLR